MNISFTPQARRQLSLLMELDTLRNGAVIGSVLGKHLIIKELFPLNFDRENLPDIYFKTLHRVGESLLGVFFRGEPPFRSEWFWEDIILSIHSPDQPLEFFRYDGVERLVPLETETIHG